MRGKNMGYTPILAGCIPYKFVRGCFVEYLLHTSGKNSSKFGGSNPEPFQSHSSKTLFVRIEGLQLTPIANITGSKYAY